MTFKSLSDRAPEYVSELIAQYTPQCQLKSVSGNRLLIPAFQPDLKKKPKLTGPCAPVAFYHYQDTRNRAFGVLAPFEWNKLPCTVKDRDTIETFKSALKTHLFEAAFG